MKKFKLLLCIILFLALTGCTMSKTPVIQTTTDIAIFNEDTTTASTIPGFKMVSYNISDNEDIKIKNIWVTRNFLNNTNYKDKLSYYLEMGYTIFIQEYNLTSEDTYDLFNIPLEKRAFKTLKNDELADVNPPMFRTGILLFKDKGFYYTPGLNSKEKSIDRIVSIFNYDKSILN